MLVAVARLGDTSDHGGSIISASTTFTDRGIPVARMGDMHRCPLHGDTPIVTGSTSHTQDKPFAYVGCKTGCGATIITGSPTFHIEIHAPVAPINQDGDNYDVWVNVQDSTTHEPAKNRTVLVRYQGQEKVMKTDENGALHLTHKQALTAEILIDYRSPKQEIKHKDIHGE